MKNLLIGLLITVSCNVFAQNTHTINFETPGVGSDWNWIMAENADNPPLEFITNPVSGGINTTAKVAKFTARLAGNPWALCFTDGDGVFTFNASNVIVKIMVYKPVISNVGFKVEGAGPTTELVVANTLINQWEELTFNFSAIQGQSYSRLVIIPDFDFTPRSQENIIYFDNIQVPDGSPSGPLSEPPVAAPTPTQNSANVISMFSDAYTNVPVDTWLTPWSQGALEEVLIVGNPTKKYTSVTFVGVETTGANLINATAMTHFHIDVWSPDANDFKIKLVDFGANTVYGGGDDTEHEITFPAPSTETWISYDIPLSDFTSLSSTEHLAQLIMVKAPMGKMFIDNVFYYGNGLSLSLNVFLEGPFNGAEMTTSLNPSFLPVNQPYSGAPWNYPGNESVTVIPSTDIVDWVLVELRDANEASLATSETVIARQAAFLKKNGSIVGLDGSNNPLIFNLSFQHGLFVVVHHRNHISVLSASEVAEVGNIFTYNFTSGGDQAFGNTQKYLGSGIWGMIAGNGLPDNLINEWDKVDSWNFQAGKAGYFQGDFDLDTQVDNSDKDDLWYNNNGATGSDYQLIWEDNFNTDGDPDPSNWTFDIGTGTNGWGNGELQYYTNSLNNVKVENGHLLITARYENYSGSNYTSGRIKTQGKFFFQYGRVDIRTKLPGGAGIWPANWMLGESFSTIGWPACGEIDIMEYRGADPNIIHGAIHTPSSFGGTINHSTTYVPNVESEFHIYSVDWDDTRIMFLVDNIPYYVYHPSDYNANTWPFDADLFLLLNVAVGGSFGGTVNNSIFPQTMEIDYIKVYQRIID